MLPWPFIWKLQMKPKEKIGVGIAMSMGVVAGIMATVKTASLNKLSTNDSYDAAHLSMFDTAEISVTIMAASLPAMRVLFRDLQSSARQYYDDRSGTARTGPRVYGNHSAAVKSQNLDLKDDGSDKGILASGSSKILRVDEVEVEVEYRGASASDGGEAYEMHSKR